MKLGTSKLGCLAQSLCSFTLSNGIVDNIWPRKNGKAKVGCVRFDRDGNTIKIKSVAMISNTGNQQELYHSQL